MSDKKLEYLAEIIAKSPDLIVLTDYVYGTFADDFKYIFAKYLLNTIHVYAFSKYFGTKGWRLGVIAKKIQELPDESKNLFEDRYSSLSPELRKIKFIDRRIAQSRAVALNHTEELSTPAQVQMIFFSLFALMDHGDIYKTALKQFNRHRQAAMYKELRIKTTDDIAENTYGKDLRDWLDKRALNQTKRSSNWTKKLASYCSRQQVLAHQSRVSEFRSPTLTKLIMSI